MKKVEKPSTVLYFQNRLVEVVGIADSKTIIMRVIRDEDKDKCPHCDKPIPTEFCLVESSPNFQGGAKPVNTIEND